MIIHYYYRKAKMVRWRDLEHEWRDLEQIWFRAEKKCDLWIYHTAESQSGCRDL